MLYCDGRTNIVNDATVHGAKGSISLSYPMPCSTTLYTSDGTRLNFPLPESKEKTFNFMNSAGLGFEAQHVRECLREGLKESPLVTPDESILVAEILEEIRKQIGLK